MKYGKSLQELAIELDRQNSAKRDYLVDTRNLIMDADFNGVSLTMHNENTHTDSILGVGEIAHSQIGSALGIPAKYYDKMRTEQPGLLATNVNTWFRSNPKVKMVRTMDGTAENPDAGRVARALLSDRYLRYDNFDVAQAVLPILADLGVSFESNEVTDSRMYIKVVNKRLTKEVRPGDYVQSGVIVTNSEVGLGSVSIRPLLYRLVCTNGMVVNDAKASTKRRHVGRANLADNDYVLYADDTLLADNRALMLKIRDTIRSALDEVHFTNLVDHMRTATEVKIETPDIPKMVELTAPEFGMTKEEGKGVLDHLIRGGDLTLYGLANAVTRYAQDVGSYDRSTELETIGYDIMNMPARMWKNLQAASVA